MNKIYDLNNKEVKVGDRVVVGQDTNVSSCYLVTGVVTDVEYKKVRTTLTIELDKSGCWNNIDEIKKPRYVKRVTYQIPREHCNILVI